MTRSEEIIAHSLREILAELPDGGSIGRDKRFDAVLSALGYFLPDVLAEIHHEWRREGIDGVLSLRVRRVSEIEAEIAGHCILISDQTIVPCHLCLQIDRQRDVVSWLELRLGQRGECGMIRSPYDPSASAKLYQLLDQKVDRIHWAYQVTYGERRS